MKKKSIIWVSDFILGLTMFTAAIVLSTVYMRNNFIFDKVGTNELTFSANSLSETLMREGIPNNWNKTRVVQIGISNPDYSLNKTKLKALKNLSQDNYENSKKLLGTKYNYLIYFKDNNNNSLEIESNTYFGHPDYNEFNIN